MSLANCIDQIRDEVSEVDADILQEALDNGATDQEALDLLEKSVNSDITDVIKKIKKAGGKVETEVLKQSTKKDELGFYSRVAKTVADMNLPVWKEDDTKPANGRDIWAKIKSSGMKKEELDTLGLEEFLTADPKAKFTRQDVINYIDNNGVNVVEVVAHEEDDAGLDVNIQWSNGEVWDDAEAWDWELDDVMNNYDTDADISRVTAFIAQDYDGWMQDWFLDQIYNEGNLEPVEKLIDGMDLTDQDKKTLDKAVQKYRDTQFPTEHNVAELMEVLGKWDLETNWMSLGQMARDDFEEFAEQQLYNQYMENPFYIYSSENLEEDLYIFGNDEQGYSIRKDNWGDWNNEINTDEIYSLNEARVQAQDYAINNGLLSGGEPTGDQAQWMDYVVDKTDYDNYREIKLTLPDIEGDFYNTVHFPDRNVLAFLRVTERDLETGETRESKPVIVQDNQGFLIRDSVSKDLLWFIPEASKERAEQALENKEYVDEPPTNKKETFFIDEFQSDWHSSSSGGRVKGYKQGLTQDEITKLEQQENELIDSIEENFEDNFVNVWENVEGIEFPDSKVFQIESWDNAQMVTLSFNELSNIMFELVRRKFKHNYGGLTGFKYDVAIKFAEQIEKTNPDWLKQVSDKIKELDSVTKQLRVESTGVPDAPFKKDEWINLGLKRAVVKAIEEGKEAIAWADAATLSKSRWGENFDYAPQYNRKMVKMIEKITGQKPQHLDYETGQPIELTEDQKEVFGWKVVRDEDNSEDYSIVNKAGRTIVKGSTKLPDNELLKDTARNFGRDIIGTEGYWIVPITEELKAQVREEGLPMFQQDRGKFYPDVNGERLIQLTEASDLSTFLHESGHLFLEFQKQLVKEYGASDNQRAILKWLELDSFDEITKEHHEQWAETFEVYLREGKAPSLKLQRAFASFARWLKKIYRVLTDGRLGRAKLNDEVREIFDRLLATEAEIAEAKANPTYDKHFQSQEESGMSDEAWKDYQEQAAKITEDAERKLDEKVLKQYMQMKTKEWKDEREPLIEEEKERLSKEPVYQIIADLMGTRKTEDGDQVPPAPFDTEKLKAYFPDGKIPNKFKFKHKKDGTGVDPAEYAEVYDYPSAKAMLNDIENSPTLKEAATAAAQQRMVDKYGDVLNDGTLEEELRESLLNESHAELLQMEISAMRAKNRQPGINRKYLKARAVEAIAAKKFSEIQPNKYYTTMIKAAQDAVRDDDPTEAKIRQLANHYLYKEALRVKDQMTKHRRFVKSAKTRKFDTKRIDPAYAQQIKMLAEMYDMRNKPEQLATVSSILDFFIGQVDELGEELTDLSLLDPNLVRAMEYRMEYGSMTSGPGFQLVQFEDMTHEDLHGVVDMLRHLSYVGRQMAEMNGEEAIRERMELIKHTIEKGGKDHKIQRGKQLPMQSARTKWNELVNTIPSLVNLTRKLDGMEDGGMWFDKIFTLISDAQGKQMELQKKFYDDFQQLMRDTSKVNLSRRDSQDFTLEDGSVVSFSSEEVFMMATYWGNESAQEAIMEGWDMTRTDVVKILSSLTPDQLRLVNTIWELNEQHWPMLQEAAIDMAGFAPPKLQATPFTINGVEMTGGHMQLFYDSYTTELKNERESARRTSSVMPTKAGTLNARVGSGGMPVLLDINNITRSVDDKIHYIAFARAGRKLRQMLNHKELKGAIERKHGPGFYRAFIMGVEGITGGRLAQETHGPIAAISRWMRSSATMMNLMYSIRNTAQQFSALPIVLKEVGPIRWVQASAQMLGNPREMVAFINEKSKFMEHRASVVNRDTKEAMKRMVATGKMANVYEEIKARGFIFQTAVDSVFAYPTWLAKYNKGMAEHQDEKRARLEADASVAESVGSGSDLHLGRIMQSNQNEMVKTLTIFGSWFNAYFQRLYKSSKGGEDFFNTSLAFDALFLPIAASSIAQALIMDEPDSDEDYVDWMMKNTVVFMLGTVPLIREIGSINEGFKPSAPVNAGPVAAVRIFKEGMAFSDNDQTALKTTVDIGRAASSVAKLPGSGQVWRSLDYIDAYLQGEEDGFSVPQMLVEGRDRDR